MIRNLQGRYVTQATVGERVAAFVPFPLPPCPAIDWSGELRCKFEQAMLALGRLDGISTLLADTSVLLYTYLRKEAVLSSMIEGTQSSLSDLLLYEMEQEPGVPYADVSEVSNYVAALNHGLKRLEEGMPLCLRLIREIHGELMKKGRGQSQAPGEFRRSQNWIGGSRPSNAVFVPPPVAEMMISLNELERFLHDQPESTPVLLKAALAHVQFETIHPFLDGNGRIGRMLITLLLCEHKVLKKPMLYLSLYLKARRQEYYTLLNQVRHSGDWEIWLAFFAEALIFTANQAVETAQKLLELSRQDRDKIRSLGRAAPSILRIHWALMERPIATSGWLVAHTGITPATVNKALHHLGQLGMISEITSQKRNRVFSYTAYIEIMNTGTELPPR